MTRISPVTVFIRSIPGDYFSLPEAARAINRSAATLRDWAKRDPEVYGPDFQTRFGQRVVFLYSLAGVERLRIALLRAEGEQPLRFAGTLGRPQIWTIDEKRDRERRLARATYYKRRVRELTESGDTRGARRASKKAAVLAHDLKVEERERRASVKTRMV